MSTDSVAPKKIQLKRKSVHFAEIPQKISLDKFLVKQLGNFGRIKIKEPCGFADVPMKQHRKIAQRSDIQQSTEYVLSSRKQYDNRTKER
ncbi:hypothetical protein ANCCEY_10352 [Ancylostoma ceylanicum]|uniref:Uncharacterized protein n=1 Tax=Ancylostoma ceylanicum TaxID=53326 RepID=A0A0D6LKR9_9BILA|nr:hypothetical protein ANCCEY_10352 [Ancylostoma ceylanicum]